MGVRGQIHIIFGVLDMKKVKEPLIILQQHTFKKRLGFRRCWQNPQKQRFELQMFALKTPIFKDHRRTLSRFFKKQQIYKLIARHSVPRYELVDLLFFNSQRNLETVAQMRSRYQWIKMTTAGLRIAFLDRSSRQAAQISILIPTFGIKSQTCKYASSLYTARGLSLECKDEKIPFSGKHSGQFVKLKQTTQIKKKTKAPFIHLPWSDSHAAVSPCMTLHTLLSKALQ